MYNDGDATKSSLPALDFFTSVKSDRDELAKEYGITDPVTRCYISYQFKGENLLSPVFNNSFWSHVAYTYNGREIDFRDQKILEQFRHLYYEIADPDSEFSKKVIENSKKMIKIRQNTRNNIIALVAHERALRKNDEVGNTSFHSCHEYTKDRYGFYQEFMKDMRIYREFRALYLNYYNYKGYKDKITKAEEPKKKKIIPPEQLSMFSEGLI
jgi:hypothetical protein